MVDDVSTNCSSIRHDCAQHAVVIINELVGVDDEIPMLFLLNVR